MDPTQILPSLPCFLVNNLSAGSVEQCKFVMDNECLEEDSMIDYVYLIYCDIGYELRYLSILLVVVLVILFFLALSAVADEFLCPSLLAVAKNLRMSDSLAVSRLKERKEMMKIHAENIVLTIAITTTGRHSVGFWQRLSGYLFILGRSFRG